MEHNRVGRRTRQQENIYFEKYYEEKFGKKIRKGVVKHDSSGDSYESSGKEDSGKCVDDRKRKRGLEVSDDSEEVIMSKGLEEKRNSGDMVISMEEVVSNENSSRVPSCLGSGMNSICVRGGNNSLDSPEVVSSCLRKEGECILLSKDSSDSGESEEEDTGEDIDDDDFEVGVEEDGSDTSSGEEKEEDKNYDDANECDERIRILKNEESNVVEELNVDDQFLPDDKKDGESSENLKGGKRAGKKQKEVIEDGLIRQKVDGMDILSSCDKKGNDMNQGIAKRLRSRLLSSSRRKLLERGTFSRPLVVDDELELSSDSEDNLPPVLNYKSDSSSPTEDTIKSLTDSEDEVESSSQEDTNIGCKNESKIERKDVQKEKKRMKGRKRESKKKSTSNSIDSEDEVESSSQEDTNIGCKDESKVDRKDVQKEKEKKIMEGRKREQKKSTSNSIDLAKLISEKIWYWQEASLPLKFTFEDEKPVIQEKDEMEKEIEALFEEMELALKAIEIGPFDPSVEDSSDPISSDETEPEVNAIELCRQGKHNLKLEEEIGMICINCSYVLEMKYVFPDFAKDPFRRWEKKILSADAETDSSFVDTLMFPNYSSKGNSNSANVEGTVWDLVPGMKEKMYPHQHEGFEFIWEHFAGGISLEKLSRNKSLVNEGNGCIINHAPGTGKTCLVIMFLLSFMRLHPKCRPVIVAPYSMLRNWEEEFRKWNVNIPFYNMNNKLSKKECEKAKGMFGGNIELDDNCSRMLKLCFWRQEKSVLAISYQLFVKLAGEHGKSVIHDKNGSIKEILLEFPDILVLDEGHTARNENTQIWKALSEVKTKRRIILSGTPFQNNFTELKNTLRLANPKFADQMSSKFVNQVKRHGQARDLAEEEWLSLTNSSVWKGHYKTKLEGMNHPFVHVYKGGILLDLPGMKDSRIDLRPTALQAKLLDRVKKTQNYLRRKALVALVSVHPSLVSDYDDLSVDERCNLENLESSPDAGVKTKFIFELIRLCEVQHERVLIFCTYVKPLKLIMNQLKSQFKWQEGREVLQMDGSADQEQRKSIISLMNDPESHVRVLLASTKASNEGINLVGASRVVILDVGFNPSVETQAISRAHRIGQKKVVYVYHLITSGTLEVDNYHSQNQKEHISKLVFSSRNSSGCCGARNIETANPLASVLQDKVLEFMVQNENLKNMFEQIYERPRTD